MSSSRITQCSIVNLPSAIGSHSENKPWACSVSEIQWRAHGFEGSKLSYLLMGAGFFHKAIALSTIATRYPKRILKVRPDLPVVMSKSQASVQDDNKPRHASTGCDLPWVTPGHSLAE